MVMSTNEQLERIKSRLYELSPYCAQKNIGLFPAAIQQFSQLIEDDEEIIYFSEAALTGIEYHGVMFITNKRVAFCKNFLTACTKEFPYRDIHSINYEINALGQGFIKINTTEFNFNGVNKLEKVVQYINEQTMAIK